MLNVRGVLTIVRVIVCVFFTTMPLAIIILACRFGMIYAVDYKTRNGLTCESSFRLQIFFHNTATISVPRVADQVCRS
jgi:hypothetical protein